MNEFNNQIDSDTPYIEINVKKISLQYAIKNSQTLVYFNDDMIEEPTRYFKIDSSEIAKLLSINFAMMTLQNNGTVTSTLTREQNGYSEKYNLLLLQSLA